MVIRLIGFQQAGLSLSLKGRNESGTFDTFSTINVEMSFVSHFYYSIYLDEIV